MHFIALPASRLYFPFFLITEPYYYGMNPMMQYGAEQEQPPVAPEAEPAAPTTEGTQRRTRSLGALCEAFLGMYCQRDGDIVHVDQAAKSLGVERRRIYDILNVLHGLGLFTKHVKSQ